MSYEQYHEYLRFNVIAPFHLKRLEALQALTLEKVLRRKNPYLLNAKGLTTSGDISRSIVDAYLSSQEETFFGNLLEGFAIYVAQTLWGGFKSKRPSLDLEFERDDTYYIVGIKSGTSWGNADQLRAMKANFKSAKVALRNEGIRAEIIAINGCLYGRENSPFKEDRAESDKSYYKYAGQAFWAFLSGDESLYQQMIAPLDEETQEKSHAFQQAYIGKINELALGLSLNFLDSANHIDWSRLVEYVSGRECKPLIHHS